MGPSESAELPAEWVDLCERISRGLAGEPEAIQVLALLARLAHREKTCGFGPFVAQIVAATCEDTGVSRGEVLGRSQGARAVTARQAVIVVAMAAGRSASAVGRALNRDHTTIVQQAKRARERLTRDPSFRALVDRVAARFGMTVSVS